MEEKMELKEEQKECLERIRDFMGQHESGFFNLNGCAGSGKTTLIDQICKEFSTRNNFSGLDYTHMLRESKHVYNVQCTAPTNKALGIVMAKIKSVKIRGATLSGFLKYSPKDSIESGTKFIHHPELLKKYPIVTDSGTRGLLVSRPILLIIDEMSMMSADYCDTLTNYIDSIIEHRTTLINQYRGYEDSTVLQDLFTWKIKVIMIGDISQLPPLQKRPPPRSNAMFARTSASFNIVKDSSIDKVTLTEIVRHDDEAPNTEILKEMCILARKFTESRNVLDFSQKIQEIRQREPVMLPGVEDRYPYRYIAEVFPDNYMDFIEAYIDLIRWRKQKSIPEMIESHIVCGRNSTVKKYNDHIRRELIRSGVYVESECPFGANEDFIFNKYYKFGPEYVDRYRTQTEGMVLNSEIVTDEIPFLARETFKMCRYEIKTSDESPSRIINSIVCEIEKERYKDGAKVRRTLLLDIERMFPLIKHKLEKLKNRVLVENNRLEDNLAITQETPTDPIPVTDTISDGGRGDLYLWTAMRKYAILTCHYQDSNTIDYANTRARFIHDILRRQPLCSRLYSMAENALSYLEGQFKEMRKIFIYAKDSHFPDMRDPWAMTTYKSQGSTFKYVFIDGEDISELRNKSFFSNSLFYSTELYTAITRASHGISIFGTNHGIFSNNYKKADTKCMSCHSYEKCGFSGRCKYCVSDNDNTPRCYSCYKKCDREGDGASECAKCIYRHESQPTT